MGNASVSGIVLIVYFVLSGIVGFIINRKRENKEGNDTSEKNEDPMNMSFDKRFPRSEECDVLRFAGKSTYYWTKWIFFNIFSGLLGVFLAILWGFMLGFSEFLLIWFILPYIDIGKRFYLPVAKLVGNVMNAVYGDCLKNLKSGNNNGSNKKNDDENDIEKYDENSSIGDPFGLKFMVAFPKSDEFDALRNVERIVYNIFRVGSYNVLCAVPGIPLLVVWGIIYGIFAFIFLWVYTPVLKVVKMFYIPAANVAGAMMDQIFGECLRNLSSGSNSSNDNDDNENGDNDDVKDPELQQTPGQTDGQTSNVVNNNNNNQQMMQMANVPVDEADGDRPQYTNIGNAPIQTNAHVYT